MIFGHCTDAISGVRSRNIADQLHLGVGQSPRTDAVSHRASGRPYTCRSPASILRFSSDSPNAVTSATRWSLRTVVSAIGGEIFGDLRSPQPFSTCFSTAPPPSTSMRRATDRARSENRGCWVDPSFQLPNQSRNRRLRTPADVTIEKGYLNPTLVNTGALESPQSASAVVVSRDGVAALMRDGHREAGPRPHRAGNCLTL